MTTLALPLNDLSRLRRRVLALAENRPAVYRMHDASGRVIYVGKAKRLRNRLLSYFRARLPTKAARIVNAAADISWDAVPSEFAAMLGELQQIRRHRPLFNVRMNRRRRVAFIKVSGGPAPKIYVGKPSTDADVLHYGPFTNVERVREGVKDLNDMLGLRDCAMHMPMVFREQGDLFDAPLPAAACLRYELDRCTGPCGGLVSEPEYRRRVAAAVAFLDTTGIVPLDRVIAEMTAASERREFELAAWWRTRFERLEWLLAAVVRARATVAALSFVYEDPGWYGDDRAYIIQRGRVLASAPAPHTPIEREAFHALAAQHHAPIADTPALSGDAIDEILLVLYWFRRHPGALARTTPLEHWLTRRSTAPST